MISLLLESSDLKIAKFLSENQHKYRLIAAPELISQVYYTGRGKGENPQLGFLNALVIDELNRINENNAGKNDTCAYLVADAAGEANRVTQLRAAYPNIRFYGFMEDFLPAFMARQANAIPKLDTLDTSGALDIVLLFAPPRSGSSLVADVLVDFGVGNTTEHLRTTLIECLRSGYRCNWAKMVRRLLHLSAQKGWVGSKLISHFLSDYLTGAFSRQILDDLRQDGHRVHPVFLYRENVALQTVSGYLASRRGIWHLIDGQSDNIYKKDADIAYDFNSLFSRYTDYRRQIASMAFFEDMFPDHLRLTYEADCEDVTALAHKISRYLNLPVPAEFSKSQSRKKIQNTLNQDFEARFRADYRDLLGREPL